MVLKITEMDAMVVMVVLHIIVAIHHSAFSYHKRSGLGAISAFVTTSLFGFMAVVHHNDKWCTLYVAVTIIWFVTTGIVTYRYTKRV